MARRPFDVIANFIGSAITDIREKLVEEAWFGRTTAPQERMAESLGWERDHEVAENKTPSAIEPAASDPSTAHQKWEQIRTKMGADLGYQQNFDHEHENDHDMER